ncbi:hypothetical protein Tco_1425943 [Tanacetum coccineum]
MRNRMFMHTAEDDNILGPMRFVSKADDYQVYGTLLPKVMTNQKMLESHAYKTYLAFTTGATSPKKARKFKKLASSTRKRTLVTVEEEEPEPTKKKKAPATTDKSKGVDLLSEAALLEEAQVKDPKGKSDDTNKGTSLKPGVPNVSKAYSFESEYESWDDSGDEDIQDSDDDLQQADDERTDFENQMTNDEDEESEDAFVHTPEDYVPTDDETKDVDKEEYKRISRSRGHSVSSTFTNAMLNLENLNADKTKAISLLNIVVQHEAPPVVVPESETLFAIHQRITDLEKDVKELKSVDNSTTVISAIKSEVLNVVKEYLESSLDDALYKVFQKHSADIIKEHSVPAEIVDKLKQQYAPQKSIEGIQKIKMEHARSSKCLKRLSPHLIPLHFKNLIRKLPCLTQ